MAFAQMTWEESSALAREVLANIPGAIWRLVDLAFSGGGVSGATVPMPDDDECEVRVQESLEGLINALGGVKSVLPLVDASGNVLPVGVRITDERMSIGLWSGLPEQRSRVSLPDILGSSWSAWRFQKSGPSTFSEEMWPIAEAVELVDRALKVVLANPGFPVVGSDVAWSERRYEIARTLADEQSLITDPVDVSTLGPSLQSLVEALDTVDERASIEARFPGRSGIPVVFLAWNQELHTLSAEIENMGLREIDSPWLPPDNLSGSGGYTWSLWTEDAWRQLVFDVYSHALRIYDQLTDRWFRPLRPFLGISAMWAVELRLNLGFMGEESGMPGAPSLSGRFIPHSPDADSQVSMTTEPVSWSFGSEPPDDESEVMEVHHPGSRSWSRWPGSFLTAAVAGTGDAPALNLAYEWLIEDLTSLGVIEDRLFRRRD